MMTEERLGRMAAAYELILSELGIDTTAPDMADTPRRAAKALLDLTSGHRDDLTPHLRTFSEPCADQLVLVGPITFWSLCEHHLLPFQGVAVVGYIPERGRIIGLSKIPRIVQHHARRLQNQERLGNGIADEMASVPGLNPLGIGVLLSSEHSCMAARGIRSSGRMTTSALRGVLLNDPSSRAEFLTLARAGLGGQ